MLTVLRRAKTRPKAGRKTNSMAQFAAADLKEFLSRDPLDVSIDGEINAWIATAETLLAQYLRRDLDAEFPAAWPSDLRHALKMVVAELDSNRSAGVVGMSYEPTEMLKFLLAPHRNMAG